MASDKNNLIFDMDTGALEEGARAVGNLEKTVNRLAAAISVAAAGEQFTGLAKSAGVLQKELLVLRLAFGKLKVALMQAFAPIGQAVLPVISKLIFAAIRLVRFLGGIIGGLLGVKTASQTVTKTTEKAVRTLAGFDQIQRLGKGADTGALEESTETLQKLSLQQKLIISKIQTLLDPLRKIDFSDAIAAFGKLKEAVAPLTRQLFAGLEWAWYNLLTPIAKWTGESFLPRFLELLAAGLGVLNPVIEAIKPYANWLWEEFLKPLGQWAGETVLQAMTSLTQKLNGLSLWMSENQGLVRSVTQILLAFMAVWAVGKIGSWIKEAAPLSAFFGGLIGKVTAFAGAFSLIAPAAGSAWSGITGVFTGAGEWFKNIINGILGFFNGALEAVGQGLNAIVAGINTLSFDVPDWVPLVGGERLGFSLSPVALPPIPMLARGAVLPANRPFMAMVGDQRHGTNIEAPLATIQEAVALVMEDQTAAMMAGFEASVGVQQEILQAVLGIRIGDDMIARAAERYQRKMAVVRGGRL